jgi:hypothetical protein
MRREAPAQPGRSSSRFLSRWRLIALCSGAGALEAALLTQLGVQSGMGLAPQVNAPVPFGAFHDLRWLIVYHNSWPGFLAEAAAVLFARGLLTALTVREAWPDDIARPAPRVLLTRSIAFTFLVALLLMPWTILLFGLAVVSVSWLFFAAVPTVLLLAFLVHHGAITSGWWRRAPAPRALGWIALTFAVLTVSAGLTAVSPRALWVPIAALTGVFNAWAWFGMVHAVTGTARSHRFLPLAPAGLAVLLGVVVGGSAIGFATVSHPASSRADAAAAGPDPGNQGGPAQATGKPVLVASGFWSSWNGKTAPPFSGHYDEQRFSYRGLDAAGRPLPYQSADTQQPLLQLERLMSDQVDALYHQTGKPVSIVAESEGSLVAKTYLTASPHAPVSTLIMVSPLVQPARVYYPPSGVAGWGVVGGLGLQGLSDTVGAETTVDLAPSQPFLRSIVQDAPALRSVLSCPVAGVRQYAVLPLADAVASGNAKPLGIPTAVVPAFHGGLLGDPNADAMIQDVLGGGSPSDSSLLSVAERIIGPASSAWQVPELPLSINSAWSQPASPDSGGVPSCSSIRTELASQLAAG